MQTRPLADVQRISQTGALSCLVSYNHNTIVCGHRHPLASTAPDADAAACGCSANQPDWRPILFGFVQSQHYRLWTPTPASFHCTGCRRGRLRMFSESARLAPYPVWFRSITTLSFVDTDTR